MNDFNLKGTLREQRAESRTEQCIPSVFCSAKRAAGKRCVFPGSRSRTRVCRQHTSCRLLGAANSNFQSLPPSRPRPSPPVLRQREGPPPERQEMWGARSGDQRGVPSSWCCAIPSQQAARALVHFSPPRLPLAHPPSFPLLPYL